MSELTNQLTKGPTNWLATEHMLGLPSPRTSGDEVFDLIIDKGTMDALLCMGTEGIDKGKQLVEVRTPI